jgi:hypothetical protein
MSSVTDPKRINRYQRVWVGKHFEVIGTTLFSTYSVGKPLPWGSILATTGEWGQIRGERYIRVRRRVKRRRSVIWLTEWIKRSDLMNPMLVKWLSGEDIERINREASRRALENVRRAVEPLIQKELLADAPPQKPSPCYYLSRGKPS